MNSNLTAVVTIYKVKEYLDKCLRSIEMQRYKSFVVLLIVGSNDEECIEICKEYEKKDDRFRVIIAEPKGLSDARNVGINNTNTKYITFIDGDDYLPDTAFEILMRSINDDCDIVIGNYKIDTGERILEPKGHICEGIYSPQEALTAFLIGHDIQFTVAWGKIYNTKLFKDNDIEYPVGKLHEDNLTTYKLLAKAGKITYIDDPVYCYVQRENSLSFNINIEKENVVVNDIPFLREYLRGFDDLKNEIDAYEIGARMSLMIRMTRHKNAYYTEFVKVFLRIKELNYLHNPLIRMRMKVLCIFVSCFPKLCYFVMGATRWN